MMGQSLMVRYLFPAVSPPYQEHKNDYSQDQGIAARQLSDFRIADRCARKGMDVLLLESGLEQQDAAHEALNAVIADVDAEVADLVSFLGTSSAERATGSARP